MNISTSHEKKIKMHAKKFPLITSKYVRGKKSLKNSPVKVNN